MSKLEGYDQIDVVAMRSPSRPTLANLFMGHHETRWLKDFKAGHIHMYKSYIDNILCAVCNKSDAFWVSRLPQSHHPNFQSTCASDGRLPILHS